MNPCCQSSTKGLDGQVDVCAPGAVGSWTVCGAATGRRCYNRVSMSEPLPPDDDLKSRVQFWMESYCPVDPGRWLVVGVSGGPDSLCLLHILHRLGFRLAVAHLDHQLRPQSAEEARRVSALAAQMGLPVVTGSEDAAAYAREHGESMEAAARALRYRFLFAQAERRGAQAVAVGHTADDQVETVLMNLIRGAGLDGLKGMLASRRLPEFHPTIPVIRPLLSVWRDETLAYCRGHGLDPVEDPSNQDLAYTRNRLRHTLLPHLESFNPGVREAIWRGSRALVGDWRLVSGVVDRAWRRVVLERSATHLIFHRRRLLSEPEGVQRRLARRAIAALLPEGTQADYATVQRALAFAAHPPESGRSDLLGGLKMVHEGDRVWLARWGTVVRREEWPRTEEDMTLEVPGEVALGEGWRLRAEKRPAPDAAAVPHPVVEDPFHVWLDAGRVELPLLVRPRRPGDRFQPLGMEGGTMKVSDFMVNEKLPRQARAHWPLICSGEVVAWIPGYRLAHPFRITEGTKECLQLRLHRARRPEEAPE